MISAYAFRDGVLHPLTVNWHTFSDGCLHINGTIGEPGDRIVIASNGGGDLESITRAELAASRIHTGAQLVALFFPYLPGARQDKPEFDVASFALRRLARLGRVICVDRHSRIDDTPVRVIEAVEVFPESLIPGPDTTIIAPDAGAADRARLVARRFGLPMVFASKRRDPGNNFRIAGYECPPVETEFAVVVDDICDGGGTFLALAESVAMPRERLSLWTSHGIYARGIAPIAERFGRIACTDSLATATRADLVVALQPHLLKALGEPS